MVLLYRQHIRSAFQTSTADPFGRHVIVCIYIYIYIYYLPASEKSMSGSSSSICSHCTSVSPCPKSMTDITRNSMLGGSKISFSPGCSENGWRLTPWTLGRSCRSHLVRSPSWPRKDCNDSTCVVVLLKPAQRNCFPVFACFPYKSVMTTPPVAPVSPNPHS